MPNIATNRAITYSHKVISTIYYYIIHLIAINIVNITRYKTELLEAK